jgi:hypothetical protein
MNRNTLFAVEQKILNWMVLLIQVDSGSRKQIEEASVNGRHTLLF